MKYLDKFFEIMMAAVLIASVAVFWFVLVSVLFPSICKADTIGIHTVSVHGKSQYDMTKNRGQANESKRYVDYNNVNPGLYYVHNGWTAGFYRNSYERNTVYGGYTFESQEYYRTRAVATVALATGYAVIRGVGDIRPMIVPGVAVRIACVQHDYTERRCAYARLSGVPAGQHSFAHLSVEYRL